MPARRPPELALPLLSLLLLPAAQAANGLHEIPQGQIRETMLPMTRAEVVAFDAGNALLTLDHRRIEEVDLPAGLTRFRLPTPPDFSLNPGQRVLVIVEHKDDAYVIRRIKPRDYD